MPSSKAFAPAAAAPLGGAAPPGLVKSSAAAGTLNDVQSTADAATFSLPEDDDLLGMSSSAPGQGMSAKDLASQAADIFRAMRPMAGPPPHGGGPGPPAALSTGLAPPLPPMHGASGGGRGRGAAGLPAPMPGQGQRFPQMAPGLGPASRFPPQQGPGSGPFFPGAPSGGRGPAPGRGRGRGRGRGGPPPGPGANRPFVAAYALTPGRMQLAGRFLPETLHQEMQQRTFLATAQLDDEALAAAELPHTLHQYHSICPLEDRALAAEHPSAAFGVGTLILKATHSGDGAAYAVRRIDGRQAVPTADLLASAEATVERWALVANHPNVIGLREAFVSDEIDATSSLYFSYDFHPGAYTLEQAHILPTHTPQGLSRTAASEEQLWSYLVQLTSALRAIHSAGLVVGSAALSPSKVLLVAPTRVRLGALGIAEALAEGAPADTPQAQRDDLAALGSLLLVLACSARNAPPTLDVLAAHYSRELVHVVAGLLAAGEGAPPHLQICLGMGSLWSRHRFYSSFTSIMALNVRFFNVVCVQVPGLHHGDRLLLLWATGFSPSLRQPTPPPTRWRGSCRRSARTAVWRAC